MEKEQSKETQIKEELKGIWMADLHKKIVEEYLHLQGIRSLKDITDRMILAFREEMQAVHPGLEYPSYACILERARAWAYRAEARSLSAQAWKMSDPAESKIFPFLAAHGIRHIDEIDYEIREAFETYLSSCRYLRIRDMMVQFDKIKFLAIKRGLEKGGRPEPLPFENGKKLFVQYWPTCLKNAKKLLGVCDKRRLVFDFSLPVAEKVKRQVYDMICYIMDQSYCGNALEEVHLTPLRILYETAAEEGWEDLETLSAEEEAVFKKNTIRIFGSDLQFRYKILRKMRKVLFLSAQKTNWDASMWFLDRLPLERWRLDPTRPVRVLDMREVTDSTSRYFLRLYLRFLLGATDGSVNTVKKKLYVLKMFLLYLKEHSLAVSTVSRADIEAYLKYKESFTSPSYFNKDLYYLGSFYQFLYEHGKVEAMPASFPQYRKQENRSHSSRHVPEEACTKLLQSLRYFPEDLRLMYLHLWAAGLRIGEVCTIQACAYSMKDGNAWLTVYQIKTRKEKQIPIPVTLYQLMKSYIGSHSKAACDYVFSQKDGSPIRYITFFHRMRRLCEEHGINREGYMFRSHDFRHRIAAWMYQEGIHMRLIRDFLGHTHTDMTAQYIHIPVQMLEDKEMEYQMAEK